MMEHSTFIESGKQLKNNLNLTETLNEIWAPITSLDAS